MVHENIGVHIKIKGQMPGEQPKSTPQHRPATTQPPLRHTFAFVSNLDASRPQRAVPRGQGHHVLIYV